jgi:hypothetical protein
MPERMTRDVDILIRMADQEKVLDRLRNAGFAVVQKLAIPGFILRSPDGTEVDVLLGSQPWVDEALLMPSADPAGFPVVALPYLVLMKMASSRGRDIGDLTTMLGLADKAVLAAVREAVRKYSPQDRDDLESLIFIGQQERLDANRE